MRRSARGAERIMWRRRTRARCGRARRGHVPAGGAGAVSPFSSETRKGRRVREAAQRVLGPMRPGSAAMPDDPSAHRRQGGDRQFACAQTGVQPPRAICRSLIWNAS